MADICNRCGLPKELCTCEAMVKEEEKIRIYIAEKRYRKVATIIEGVSKELDTKQIIKELKTGLACGGTIKNGVIELQGNHKNKAKQILVKLGFPEDKIDVR
jgi:translation initiation factor 1